MRYSTVTGSKKENSIVIFCAEDDCHEPVIITEGSYDAEKDEWFCGDHQRRRCLQREVDELKPKVVKALEQAALGEANSAKYTEDKNAESIGIDHVRIGKTEHELTVDTGDYLLALRLTEL
jgi:hypothetical protein